MLVSRYFITFSQAEAMKDIKGYRIKRNLKKLIFIFCRFQSPYNEVSVKISSTGIAANIFSFEQTGVNTGRIQVKNAQQLASDQANQYQVNESSYTISDNFLCESCIEKYQ